MHATTTHASGPTLPDRGKSSQGEAGRVVTYFFALDTDGRIVWPFRYTWTESGVQPQRWRFGRWVSSNQLRAFMSGHDDQYVAATAQEVEDWIRRHSDSWHPMIHSAE